MRHLFACFIERSQVLTAALIDRYADRRRSYAQYGTTPLEVFAGREHTTPETLYQLAIHLGSLCREPFRRALNAMAQ